jgi:hypothetical protein
MRSMVEGHGRVVLTTRGSDHRANPSTIGYADGPPPRFGEDYHGFHAKNLSSSASP